MRIIFCLSYVSVPQTLALAETSQGKFLIVSPNKELCRFMCELYGQKKVLLLANRSFLLSWKSPVQLLVLLLSKRRCWKKFRGYRDTEVYFFFVAYAFFEAWLIRKLAMHNKIHYTPALDISHRPQANSMLARCNRLWIRWAYNYPVLSRCKADLIMYAVSSQYLRALNAANAHIPDEKQKIAARVAERFSYAAPVMLLTGGTVEAGRVSTHEYAQKTKSLIVALGCRNIAVKCHPKYQHLQACESEITNVIPNYIPANILFTSFRAVIGYFSAALVDAANAGVVVISLLRYYDSQDPRVLQDSYNFMEVNLQPERMIYYPESLPELQKIVSQNIEL